MHNLQKFGCNCWWSFIMTKVKWITMSAAKIKELKLSTPKMTVPFFIFLESQMHLYPSYLFIFMPHLLKQYLNTHFSKYTDILIFNFILHLSSAVYNVTLISMILSYELHGTAPDVLKFQDPRTDTMKPNLQLLTILLFWAFVRGFIFL